MYGSLNRGSPELTLSLRPLNPTPLSPEPQTPKLPNTPAREIVAESLGQGIPRPIVWQAYGFNFGLRAWG